MTATRDRSSSHDLGESSRMLRRLADSLTKKMKRFPEGRCVIVVGALTREGRTSTAAKKTWQVLGNRDAPQDRAFLSAVEKYLPAIDATVSKQLTSTYDPADFLTIPGNAEKRARKLRTILAHAWRLHVAGSDFEGTKQMYRVVKMHPHMKFLWWEDVAGRDVPFENTSVADPDVSMRVLSYIGPRIYDTLCAM